MKALCKRQVHFLSAVWSYSFWPGIHMQMAKRGAAIYSTAKRQIEELWEQKW